MHLNLLALFLRIPAGYETGVCRFLYLRGVTGQRIAIILIPVAVVSCSEMR